ncbi:D-aminoacyl-tRNA deacylase [Halomicroarcula sp. GCM10025709]|uniref:D-aminoacyl-tRNA deacylase n=1 Tax=Haloarcula TaxID=2237 RepID=UPI0024C3FA84|nr:D-aminoacyl-tRNA deacylase [Halomicroarcula sp. YJ-61-S]
MLAIVVSRADEASEHVGQRLLELADWTESTDDSRADADGGGTVYRTDGIELREFDALHLDLDGVAAAFDDPDLLVFASRHAGETDELLTAHHTGNFGAAEFGGADGSFARACPNAHRRVVESLTEHAPDGYEVGMECTHHGPTDVGVPSMFVEVGSAAPQWRDPDAAEAVARAILDLDGVAPDTPREDGSRRQLLGIGGGHYAPRFERVVRETDWAVGHVAADWCLDDLEEWAETDEQRRTVLQRAVEASGADFALFEGDRPTIAADLETLGVRVVEETFVRETTGVPLDRVAALEADLTTVGDGLRFGDRASEAEEWSVVDLPSDLLTEVSGIDDEATRRQVERTALAFVTEQNGTVVTGPFAVPAAAGRGPLVDALRDILERKYDSVTRDGDELVARETAFDPSLAETAGVPEGPKFGRLAAGEPVEVDGERITPERFQRERIRRFEL